MEFKNRRTKCLYFKIKEPKLYIFKNRKIKIVFNKPKKYLKL